MATNRKTKKGCKSMLHAINVRIHYIMRHQLTEGATKPNAISRYSTRIRCLIYALYNNVQNKM